MGFHAGMCPLCVRHFITDHVRSTKEVMFSQVSVVLFKGGCTLSSSHCLEGSRYTVQVTLPGLGGRRVGSWTDPLPPTRPWLDLVQRVKNGGGGGGVVGIAS